MEWKFGAFHTQKNLIQGSLLFTSMIGVSNNESPQNLAQNHKNHVPKKVNKNADMTWKEGSNDSEYKQYLKIFAHLLWESKVTPTSMIP